MTDADQYRVAHRTWLLWLLLAALWVVSLQSRPLIDPDEGRYAEIPREMWVSGDWVTPRLNGLVYFDKPPLQYWATATLYSLFGAHEWTARFWSAILAFACMPMVFAFARRIGYGHRTSIVAALLLAINPYFVIFGQIALLDQGFTFFVTATLFAFALAQRESRGSATERNYMLVAWVALALAVLSKGIVAIALLGATLAVYAAVTRSLGFLWRMHWLPGLPLFGVVTVPWFLAAQHAQPVFARYFFIHEHLQRFLTTIHDRAEPWWFFLPFLLFAWLPVIWSARAALVSNWKSDAVATDSQTGKLLLVWCAVVLVFFSLSHSKLVPYILPMMPPLAVLFGRVVCNQPRSFDRARAVVVSLVCLAAAGMMIYGYSRTHALDAALAGWSSAAIAVAIAGTVATRAMRNARPAQDPRAMPLTWVILAATSIAGIQALFGAYNHLPKARSARDIARTVSVFVGPGTTLFTVGHYRQSLGFYLARTLDVYEYRRDLAFGLSLVEGGGNNGMDEFRSRWEMTTDGIAFIDPKSYATLQETGLPGRIIASDGRSVVVSRQ
jgi:4-amino-4-deoxy-L-arabinose transferase-like glycosyltransferase